MSSPPNIRPSIRFNRNELAGAFGDIGLDLPLIILLIATCQLHAINVLVLFGLCQVLTGLFYRLPIPVQPLKAMATIAIAGGINGATSAHPASVSRIAKAAAVGHGAVSRLPRRAPS